MAPAAAGMFRQTAELTKTPARPARQAQDRPPEEDHPGSTGKSLTSSDPAS
jgi:hypothetical protein